MLFSAASQQQVLNAYDASVLNAVVAVSMLTTPLLMVVYGWRARRSMNRQVRPHDVIETHRPVIIGGFGRVGQVITRLLNGIGIPPTVIERDPNQIELVRQFGFQAYYGDITRPDVLRAAGIAQARLLVLAIDDPEDALKTARYVREHYPQVRMLARVRNRTHAFDYIDLDIGAVRETFFSSLRLGEMTLRELGFGPLQAHRTVRRFRRHDEAMLRESHPLRHDLQQMVAHSHRSREDLARLLRQESGRPTTDEAEGQA